MTDRVVHSMVKVHRGPDEACDFSEQSARQNGTQHVGLSLTSLWKGMSASLSDTGIAAKRADTSDSVARSASGSLPGVRTAQKSNCVLCSI
jgi:hypothetical protein